jgi:hypothetical protein
MTTSRIEGRSGQPDHTGSHAVDELLTGSQRAAAARLMHAAFDAAAVGHVPGLAVLVGPAGVGKTFALDCLAARLPAPPRFVICRPGEDLSALPQAPPPAGAAPAPVLVLDDAHRLTDAGLRVLETLLGPGGNRAREKPAVAEHGLRAVICAGRGRLLTLLTRRVGLASRVSLRATIGPMTAEETGRLVTRVGGLTDPRLAGRLHELTGGVPRAILRLCGIAAVVGAEGLGPDEFEAIQRRSSLPAA